MESHKRAAAKSRKAAPPADAGEPDWPAADNLSYHINLVHRLLDRQTKKFLNENTDLSSAERSVLGFLAWHSPYKIVEIAEKTAIFKSQISQAMRALEGKKLVERIGDPSDNRSPYFRVTPKGFTMQKKIAAWTRKRQKDLAAQLTRQQQTATLDALKILARFLDSAP